MIIECTLKRAEPIVVPIGNEKYEFAPDGQGRNVAEVWLERHIEAFLAVPHLYRKVEDGEAEPEGKPESTTTDTQPEPSRKDLVAALKARNIKFAVTESTDALRAKLAGAAAA
jgi:hypothetical protein